ncbi:probable RNA 3'-terminal phosphate cyclase-like protein [Phlebotomus argentipes]|uniref:probable RNA 3'-terminal phosphate cyclase-like protein n=1 Tax=Phlebotomus argentipes TaxID=94469 RepID=UPI002892E7A1|nr:probable RNA 3'-terminal phosphate cyclase-like protein [Phlebotomus argentipes]
MVSIGKEGDLLLFKGSNFLKQRLLLATLSGKPVKITSIRSFENPPGLREYEVSLIRLLDKITNGTRIELNETGTAIIYEPGLLLGGTLMHECSLQRSIGYYLDALLALGPFCKSPLCVTLRGVTNSHESPSVDHISSSAVPILKRFLIVDDGLELKVLKRGLMPLGGGEVLFKCPVRKNLHTVQLLRVGMVKRIRGVVYACRVSPALANRTVEAAKGVMLNFLPDVYINTHQVKGKSAGNSPGFGINLVAETTDGCFYAAETVSNLIKDGTTPSVPEELGKETAQKLLEEIYRGGCVDSTFQWLVTLYMALGQKNVAKFLTGPLSDYTIHFLQHLREFFSITFKLENHTDAEEEDDEASESPATAPKILMTCVGIGYSNINKRMM